MKKQKSNDCLLASQRVYPGYHRWMLMLFWAYLSAQGGGSGSTPKPIGSQMTNLPGGNYHSDRGRYDDLIAR